MAGSSTGMSSLLRGLGCLSVGSGGDALSRGLAAAAAALHRAVGARSYSTGSLHVVLEPLEGSEYEGTFQLSLTRPEAKNAIGRQMLREMREALHELARERATRCLLLRSGVAGVFCAGADLKERAGMSAMEAAEFVTDLRATFRALEELPMPTVAVVNGYALGGGAEMALACDMRVGGPDALFAFPETRLGIIPGAGGTARLPRVVGRPRAKELIFTGRRVDAQEALRIGLLDHAVGGEESAQERALALVRDIARGGPVALRCAKAAVNAGSEVDLGSALVLEQAFYAQVIPTNDRTEGLRAFAEKRPPQFTGT